jgi:hypothetical protein
MQPSSPTVATCAAVLPFEASDGFAAAFDSVAASSRDLINASFETWAQESRSFLEGMAHDNAAAFKRLGACKSPIDVIAVEQTWLLARSSAYFDASRRLLQAAASATSAPEPEFDVPLPE